MIIVEWLCVPDCQILYMLLENPWTFSDSIKFQLYFCFPLKETSLIIVFKQVSPHPSSSSPHLLLSTSIQMHILYAIIFCKISNNLLCLSVCPSGTKSNQGLFKFSVRSISILSKDCLDLSFSSLSPYLAGRMEPKILHLVSLQLQSIVPLNLRSS